MIGRAEAMGAISVVNAIACGKGATVSVKLPTSAKLELREQRGSWHVSLNGRKTESTLVVQTVRHAIRKLGRDPSRYSGSIQTATSAPIGVGLKTSSSSSVAVALATFSAFGRTAYRPSEALDCSVSASLSAGVSVTGALDDAASCLLGGVNFANNSSGRILSTAALRRQLKVVIKVPKGKSRRGQVSLNEVRKFSKTAESIFRVGRRGGVWKAMTLNGFLYSSIYGYHPLDALRALEAGALGAGLSGTGPAFAAVFDESGKPNEIAKDWKDGGATVIETETSDRGAVIG
ncbi:MAG: shikimate kinase [Nitrososphaerota archaeon]|nr:shikimate kinase [Nitrososphaerota archaeon]MDG6956196.1 shikimate kinase [Nitrososphaerota archaeon]MDG6958807.1 shikimate kinase [Nitrososphaerota archaeon]MDG6960417.1 shikimate kinase [Nitrososphaerota archaeon]MDG6965478.1 shikimate kinase [Nitrososphaerota archaeon]